MRRRALDIWLKEFDNLDTRRTNKYMLQPLLVYLGDKDVLEVEPLDLKKYQQNRLDKSERAPTTRNKHIKAIKAFFNYLVKELRVIPPPSPASALRTRKVHIDQRKRKQKAMTDDELEKLLDFVKWNERNHAIVLFLATTGARAGGAATLTLENLDLENLRAIVLEKGSKTRQVMYDERTAHALRLWLIRRPPAEHSFVFTYGTHPSKPLSVPAIGDIISRACKKVGLRRLGPHSLRHRIGHKFADEGVPPPITQSYLGHSNVQTTLEYYYPDDWKSMEAALRQLIQTPQSGGIHARIVELKKSSK